MTKPGKCDACRSRKVKCDEKRPTCTACCKVGQICTHSYGQPSFFVVEDPTQFSGHGKSRVAPVLYPIRYHRQVEPNAASKRFSKERNFAKDRDNTCEELTTELNPNLSDHASSALSGRYTTASLSSLTLLQPSCPATSLRSRFVAVLNSHLENYSPFVIDLLWAEGIPARIGHDRIFDLAVKSAMDSFEYYRNGTPSTRKLALSSRCRALRSLRTQLCSEPLSLSVAQAIRMHFYSEIFLDLTNWPIYHIHMTGLFEALKSGSMVLSREMGYWEFLQSIYFDEVIEATYRGKRSRFDTGFFRATTFPSLTPSSPPTFHTVSMNLMHCWIQIPRLICLVRKARSQPSPSTLKSTISLASVLWKISRKAMMDNYFMAVSTSTPLPSDLSITNIVGPARLFNSVHNITLWINYWSFIIYLCGLTHTLHEFFPAESVTAALPSVPAVLQTDADAAIHLAQTLVYALSESSYTSFPLLLFRIIASLHTSTWSWIRAVRHTAASLGPDATGLSVTEAVSAIEPSCRERIMIEWILKESRSASQRWAFPESDLDHFDRTREFMSGGVEWHELIITSAQRSSEVGKKAFPQVEDDTCLK